MKLITFAAFSLTLLQGISAPAGQNLFKGLRYSVETELPPLESTKHSYPDNEKIPMLTDGKAQGTWAQSIGWGGRGIVTISFRLKNPITPEILRFHVIGGREGGVCFPEKISVYGKKGEGKTLIGISSTHPEEREKKVLASWLVADILSDEKYDTIIIEITPGKGMVMVDEIEMYSSVSPDISVRPSSTQKNKKDKYNR